MSNLQVKNLADVSKVISLEPLDPGDERYTDLSKARSTRDLSKLRLYLENSARNGSWASAAFIGHRGSGKSTELKRLEGELAEQFTSLHLMVDNSLQLDCDYTDLLLWLVDSVVNYFDKESLPLDSDKAKAVADWFAERTIETAEAFKSEVGLETSAEASSKVGANIGFLAYSVKLLARLKARVVGNREHRKVARQKLQNYSDELLQRVNDLLAQARATLAANGRPGRLLIIQDNLDRLGRDAALRLFRDNGDFLRRIDADCIWTAPINSRLSPFGIHNLFNNIFSMPTIKVHDRAEKKVDAGIDGLVALVEKRVEIKGVFGSSSLSDLGNAFFSDWLQPWMGENVCIGMATRFVSIDRDTPLLLPPNLRDWVAEDHLVHFILDAVGALDLKSVKVNERGTGSEQYPPTMLLALLIYSYATGTFGSRRIEQSTHDSVPVRVLTGDTHPDHDTICTFRRENKELLTESFVKVLQLAQQLKVLQVGQITVAVDGTKVLANASKHSAVSYERAGQMIQQLELEVRQLVAKAEQADSTPLQEGLSLPAEIARRQERKAALAKARAEIEARAQARYAAELAEHEQKLAERAARKERGQRVGGKPPQPPTATPGGQDQYNFTDAESRIMKAGNGNHFEQSYNAQAAVEVTSRLIVGQRMSQSANDKQELVADLQAIPAAVGTVAAALVDSGFYSEQAVQTTEQNGGPKVYAALERKSHHRSVVDLEQKAEPAPPIAGASMGEVMKHRLATAAGKAKYKLRQQTVEPVFGIIKSVLGFRRFLLRGLEKVKLEWTLVCAAYNLKRLHRLGGMKLAVAG